MDNNIKFGVSYNVFDGVELLEDSINHIRNFVDYISIIFQTKSYWNNDLSQREITIVNDLYDRGLINEIVMYDNNFNISIHGNEITKRNLGLQSAIRNGCTHFMSLDCDEFYVNDEFKMLIDFHKNNPNDISYIPLVAYYKDSKYLINPEKYNNNDLYVSGFYPTNLQFKMASPLRIKVDPTRKVTGGKENNIKIFNKDEIKMHHLSYVRVDLYKKINNSPAKLRYGNNPNHLEKIVNYYINFERDGVAVSTDGHLYDIITVDNNIELKNYHKHLKKYESQSMENS